MNPITKKSDKEYVFNAHKGQWKALQSQARFILLLAGTQSGKTITGPIWLKNEIKSKGSGDYLVVAPNYPLMQKKVLPEFLKIFGQFGKHLKADRIFELNTGGIKANIFFGHAQDPDSLESATAKAAWLDEAGQKKFKFGSWEAIIRRLSIHQGRVLITTTPYTLGWLKNEIHDKADGEEIELIQFDSRMNPAFPDEEYYRQKEAMPAWKFNMMYRGIFTRPAGMIYDCFTPEHKIPRFTIPNNWKRFIGMDFGGVNTVAVYLAKKPDEDKYFIFDSYKEGSRTAEQHAREINKGYAYTAYGGSWSEDQWRKEFKEGGLHIHKPPIKDVEVGIDRVYSLFKQNKLFVFDDLQAVISDLETYSRELDDEGQPTEKIEDKETFHYCVSHNSIIETSKGKVKIQDIKEGDMVLTRDGYKKVAGHAYTGSNEIVKINTGNYELECTLDHPVYTFNRGFVKAKNLMQFDIVCTLQTWKKEYSKNVLTEDILNQKGTLTEDITEPQSQNMQMERNIFIEQYGLSTTARFLRAVIFTIKTVIVQIIGLRTLNAFQGASILKNMRNYIQKILRKKEGSGLRRRGKRLKNGTNQKKGESGTKNMQNARGLDKENIMKRNASIVEAHSFQNLSDQNTAAINASQHTGESQGLMTLKKNASSAEKDSRQTNIPTLNFVQGVALQRTGIHKETYNIAVEECNEYFANGILTHNCDAIRYISSYLGHTSKKFQVFYA